MSQLSAALANSFFAVSRLVLLNSPRYHVSICVNNLRLMSRLEPFGKMFISPLASFVLFMQTIHFLFHAVNANDMAVFGVLNHGVPKGRSDIKRIIPCISFNKNVCIDHKLMARAHTDLPAPTYSAKRRTMRILGVA